VYTCDHVAHIIAFVRHVQNCDCAGCHIIAISSPYHVYMRSRRRVYTCDHVAHIIAFRQPAQSQSYTFVDLQSQAHLCEFCLGENEIKHILESHDVAVVATCMCLYNV